MFIQKRRIVADDEIEEMQAEGGEGAVEVDPEAAELLFEVQDVAEFVAEVTGEDVDVTADGDEVVFGIGEDEYTITAEGDEEVLEASTKVIASKKAKSTRRKPVSASTNRASRPVTKKTSSNSFRVSRKVSK